MKYPPAIVSDTDGGLRDSMPGVCFYCRQPIGSLHSDTCVADTHKVHVKFAFTLTLEHPKSWDKERIKDFHNLGSHCADNELSALIALAKERGCLCGLLEAEDAWFP